MTRGGEPLCKKSGEDQQPMRVTTKDQRDQGAGICGKNGKLLTFHQNVKFDRVALIFASKILGGRFILFLEMWWWFGAKVNYKQLHLAAKSI